MVKRDGLALVSKGRTGYLLLVLVVCMLKFAGLNAVAQPAAYQVCARFSDPRECERTRGCRFEEDPGILLPDAASAALDGAEDDVAARDTRSPTARRVPTKSPTTSFPTQTPSKAPTNRPTRPTRPTTRSPVVPTSVPSRSPTYSRPSTSPSPAPTHYPSARNPVTAPSRSKRPSRSPVFAPTKRPTREVTKRPSRPTVPPPVTPPPSVGACLPRCGQFLNVRLCPDNIGCGWRQGKCTQVRGFGITASFRPTASPVENCRYMGSKAIPTASVDQIRFSPVTANHFIMSTFSNEALLYLAPSPLVANDYFLIARLQGHTELVVGAAISHSELIAATCSLDRTVRLYNVEDGSLRHVLRNVHVGAVVDLAFPDDANSPLIATASHDSTAGLWDVNTGALLARLRGHQGPLSQVHFLHKQMNRLVTASYDARAIIWDTQTRRAVRNMTHVGPIHAMLPSVDGELIAVASDIISVFDSATGRLVVRLTGHNDLVRQLVFSLDGTKLLSLAVEDAPILWDINAGRSMSKIESPSRRLITSVDLTGDGRPITLFDGGLETWTTDGSFLLRTAAANASLWTMVRHPPSGAVIAGGMRGTLSVFRCP